jgi:hypothetical protein
MVTVSIDVFVIRRRAMCRSYRAWLLLGLVLLTVPACVELTGQRIKWSYDAVKDEIQILLFYDGIHDSGGDQNGQGVEQILKFVQDGDFMLLDWPFHFKRAQAQREAEDQAARPVDRDRAKLRLSIRSELIGRYRAPDGRIGAVQRLTIPAAKDFVRRANELISRSILESETDPHAPLPCTEERIRAAAKAGHAWIALDGQSLRVTLPVEPEEWSRAKAEFLKNVTMHVAEAFGEKGTEEQKRAFLCAIRCLAAAPVSYLDEGNRVQFVIGRRDAPATVRLELRDKYEPSLEKAVEAAVPTDFDKAAAQSLLGRGDASPAVAAALKAGIPEASVGALIRWAKAGDDAQKAAVARRLETWAEQWNRDHRLPEAPKPNPLQVEYLAAWDRWYAEMRQFPLGESGPRKSP